MNNPVAILVFSRTPSAECKHKGLLTTKSALHQRQVASLMVNNVLLQTRSTATPVFYVNQHQQNGTTFGERITNAIAGVFDQGFDKVIAVGNDCPQLNATILHKSIHLLQTADTVFGPDKRGGAYLIGVHRKAFEPALFQQLAWQTGELMTSLQRYAAEADCTIALLPALADVNELNDLFNIKKLLSPTHTLVQYICNLLQQQVHRSWYCFHAGTIWCSSSQSLRAPPALL